MTLTFVELFAGAGGLSMGLELAGWQCVAHAEIEPHARAVLRQRFPDVELVGDVTGLDGAKWKGITLLSGGSPCQDISVAGKRRGMVEGSETRSSLFFEQVRIWRESDAPYFLWENVLGAFSSNGGRDFAAVLSSLVGSAIAVPASGWRSGGVAAGRTGVAAWRVCDAQFFGVPQRRRRVFVLCSRAGGVDPAVVLSLAEGLPGDSAPSVEAGEGVARAAEGRAHATSRGGVVAPTISGGAHPGSYNGQDGAQIAEAIILASGQANAETGRGVSPALTALTALHEAPILSTPLGALSFDTKGTEVQVDIDIAATLRGMQHDQSKANGGGQMGVIAFDRAQITHPENRANPQPGDPAPTLAKGGTMHVAQAFKASHFTRGKDGAPSEVAPTLSMDADRGDQDTLVSQPLAVNVSDSVAKLEGVMGTLSSRESSGGVGGGAQMNAVLAGVPRRLLPIECERLQGWPDNHTDMGLYTAEDFDALAEACETDVQLSDNDIVIEALNKSAKKFRAKAKAIRKKGITVALALSDSARYRLCGNGVAKPVPAWIGFNLRAAIEQQASHSTQG